MKSYIAAVRLLTYKAHTELFRFLLENLLYCNEPCLIANILLAEMHCAAILKTPKQVRTKVVLCITVSKGWATATE